MSLTAALQRYWTRQRLALLVGFGLTLLGSVGSYAYVEPAQKAVGDRDEQLRTTAITQELLKNATAQYYMFEQQGSLIFAISASNTNEAAEDIIAKLRQLSLLDRTYAVRQLIGQLAMAGELDYRQTSDAYQAVIDQARADFTLANFLAVKGFEKGFVSRAQTHAGQLAIDRIALVQQRAQAYQAAEQRKLVLLVLNALGAAFLLAANVVAEER